jgi:hypothetical protein
MLQSRYVGLLQLRQYKLTGQIGLIRSENVSVLLSGTFHTLYILFRRIKALLCETMVLVYTSDIRRMSVEHKLNNTDK